MSSHVDVQISFLIAYFSTLGTEMFFARLQMMALNMEGESELSGELLATIRKRTLENLLEDLVYAGLLNCL